MEKSSGRHPFDDHVGADGLHSSDVGTIQVNVGLKCNQACRHCHVQASPKRTEVMTWPVMEAVLRLVRQVDGVQVDITGGAPELNPDLRRFVSTLRTTDVPVTVRTNLTVLLEPQAQDFPEFYKKHNIHLVASLPCYLEENVDAQRGHGAHKASVKALHVLNKVGYGIEPSLPLDLVYNPGGPALPPSQAGLEEAYRRELNAQFGIRFTRLLTITNVPIGRFRAKLRAQGAEQAYLKLLADAFNPDTVEGLMCRCQISVRWDGALYDCDFNLALDLPARNGKTLSVFDVTPAQLARRKIVVGDHCFACTAGCGSSCGGALVGDSE